MAMASRRLRPGRPGGGDVPHRERGWGEQPCARRRHRQLVRGDPPHAASARERGRGGRAALRRRLRPAEGRARRGVLAERLGVRPRVGRERVRRACRCSGSPTGFCPPRSSTGDGGFDYYAELDNGRGETATLPEAAAEAPEHVWPLPTWTTVDLGVGAIRRDSAAVVDRLRAHVGKGEPGARARQRPGAVEDRSVGVRRCSRRLHRRARPGEPPAVDRANPAAATAQVPIDFAGGEGDLAVDGRRDDLRPRRRQLSTGRSLLQSGGRSDRRDAAGGDDSGHGPGRARTGRSCTRTRRRCGCRRGPGRPPLAPEQQLCGRTGRAQRRRRAGGRRQRVSGRGEARPRARRRRGPQLAPAEHDEPGRGAAGRAVR